MYKLSFLHSGLLPQEAPVMLARKRKLSSSFSYFLVFSFLPLLFFFKLRSATAATGDMLCQSCRLNRQVFSMMASTVENRLYMR